MNRGSTHFLRLAVLALGLGVLAICVFALPAGIMSDKVVYYRPILTGLYFPAIPFFMALYQTIRLLDNIDGNKAFSKNSMARLKFIRNCAIAISALFTLGSPYIYMAAQWDDAPGIFAMALVIIFASTAIATAAGVLEKLVKNAVEIKSENDLTV